MIQKNKSRKRALLKYLLSAPVFVLMLILSSATVDNYSAKLNSNKDNKDISAPPQTLIKGRYSLLLSKNRLFREVNISLLLI